MKTRIACAALFLVSISSAAELRRKPYLQDVRQDRATILWTSGPTTVNGEVRLSLDGIHWESKPSTVRWLPSQETGLPDSVCLHRADLRGLRPATQYFYRVLLDGTDQLASTPQRELQFRTAPAEGSFRFLVFGDSGDGAAGQTDVANRMFSEPADFVLHTGDLAYDSGTFDELENYYFSAYWPLMRRLAFFAVPGNHDYYFNDGYAYKSAHSPPNEGVPADGRGLYYSFDWSNAHFVGLDTNTPLADAIVGTGKMLEWLENDLARTRQAWRIVYFHHTPFPTSAHREHEVCAQVRARLTPILERHQVHLVLTGHEHLYQRTLARRGGVFFSGRGTVYVTTGGGGSRVYDAGTDDFIVRAAGVSHFLRVAINGPSLQVDSVSRTGEVLDRFLLESVPVIDGVTDVAGRSAIPAGGLVSIYGWNLSPSDASAGALPWPATLNAVAVKAGSVDAPLLFAGRGQINTQIPFDILGDVALEVTTPQGNASVPVRVLPVAPSFLRLSVDSKSIPAVTHRNGAVVSSVNPAVAGEWLTAWMTGLGPVDPPVAAGQSADSERLSRTTLPVRVVLGDVETVVSFAGLTPGLAGVYQVNFRVPQGGTGQPLRVYVATVSVSDVLEVAN